MAGKGRRDNSGGINIGVRLFLIAIGIIFILMVALISDDIRREQEREFRQEDEDY